MSTELLGGPTCGGAMICHSQNKWKRNANASFPKNQHTRASRELKHSSNHIKVEHEGTTEVKYCHTVISKAGSIGCCFSWGSTACSDRSHLFEELNTKTPLSCRKAVPVIPYTHRFNHNMRKPSFFPSHFFLSLFSHFWTDLTKVSTMLSEPFVKSLLLTLALRRLVAVWHCEMLH